MKKAPKPIADSLTKLKPVLANPAFKQVVLNTVAEVVKPQPAPAPAK